jgi:hypothetical protein
VGHLDGKDVRQFLRSAQEEPIQPAGSDAARVVGTVKPPESQDPLQLKRTLKRASRDPYEAVRAIAKQLSRTKGSFAELP